MQIHLYELNLRIAIAQETSEGVKLACENLGTGKSVLKMGPRTMLSIYSISSSPTFILLAKTHEKAAQGKASWASFHFEVLARVVIEYKLI